MNTKFDALTIDEHLQSFRVEVRELVLHQLNEVLSVDLHQHLRLRYGVLPVEGKPLVNELQELGALSHAGVIGLQPLHNVELCTCMWTRSN